MYSQMIFNKGAKIIQQSLLSTIISRKLDIPMPKINKNYSYTEPHANTAIISKWVKDLNVTPRTIQV